MKRIIVGGDQISVNLKSSILDYLHQSGLEAFDAGTDTADVIVDYPYYAQRVAQAVVSGEYDGGIVICGTGLGVSIAANKIPGVRAALCHDVFTAHLARSHNDANVLALGAWVVSPERMPGIVQEWLVTPYEGGRHTARLKMMDDFNNHPYSNGNPTCNFSDFIYSMAVSIHETLFGPVLFMGKLEEGMKALSDEGFHSIEISLRSADDITIANLEELIDRHRLKISAFATGQGCIHDHLCMTTTETAITRKAVDRFKKITEFASTFNAGVIMGGARGKFTGAVETWNKQRKIGVANIAECGEYAHQLNVPFFIEPINHYETNFINTAAEALDLINEIGVPSAKILLDAYHMNLEETDFDTTIKAVGDRLGYFHLVDSNRQAPGQGHLDLKSILTSLHSVGYRGIISAEILPLPDSLSAVKRTSNFLTSLGVEKKQPINIKYTN